MIACEIHKNLPQNLLLAGPVEDRCLRPTLRLVNDSFPHPL